jgi:hypothetical protein
MAHGKGDICGCFPTGLPYPGIAEFLLTAPPAQLGLAEELAVDGPWEKVPLAVIDTETTGKDAARGDRIVEVAVVHCCDGAVTERHGFLINPGVPIPAEASAVHGIRDEDVKDKPRGAGSRSRQNSAESRALPVPPTVPMANTGLAQPAGHERRETRRGG